MKILKENLKETLKYYYNVLVIGDNIKMKLLTKSILEKLPPLYSQEHISDPTIQVKFFTPWSNWTWYGIEYDGNDLFFGYVEGLENDMGYFSLSELQSINGPFGLKIERDLYFNPRPLSKVKK